MESLAEHYGHEITIARYNDLDGEPVNYAIECQDCFTVIIDEDTN